MTPRPIDPVATAARVAFLERRIIALRDRITDTQADIAWHLEQIAFERAQIDPTPEAREAPGTVRKPARPTPPPPRQQPVSDAPRRRDGVAED